MKQLYERYIYERYTDLKNNQQDSTKFTNNDLCKIFEYYTCIKLFRGI